MTADRRWTRPFLAAPLFGLALGCASSRDDGPRISEWEALYPEVVDPSRETEGPRAFFRARPPSVELRKKLDAAIDVYVNQDDEAFVPVRDEIAAEPVGAFWLTRTLILFVIKARDAAPASRDATELLVREPVWARPIRHIRELGPAAVPTIVVDLIRNVRSDRVDLGRELLEEVGPAGFPRWRGVLALSDQRARRRLTEILAAWSEPGLEVLEMLGVLSRDPDFGIRAVAWRGLGRDPARVPVLVAALEVEADPFVRRQIALALGAHRSRASAEAILIYMERCVDEGDQRGTVAADEALRKMSGRSKRASLMTWRSWVSTLREED